MNKKRAKVFNRRIEFEFWDAGFNIFRICV